MFKRLVVLSALVISTAVAHADSISGYFSATGTDTFTPSTITFGPAVVGGAIGGTFASYLTDGNPISFLPGTLPYRNGMNTPPDRGISFRNGPDLLDVGERRNLHFQHEQL